MASKNPDVEKGGREYPGLFQKSLTEYMGGMGKLEVEETEKIRKEWQATGPPKDVQLRYLNPLLDLSFLILLMIEQGCKTIQQKGDC